MFRNYFKTAWRNLTKNKVFSIINILGLTIGITTCMMIFLYIMNEFSVDNFHERKDNIYRVMRGSKSSGIKAPYLSGPYATNLLNDFQGEILSAVRVLPSNGLVTFGDKAFNEKKLYITDPEFFSFFSFPLVKGNPSTVLKEPYSIVLSESTARKYFGNNDPVNKVLQMDKNYSLKVTGVFKDIPANSHLDFDMVMPLSIYYKAEWFDVWMNNNNFTYVLLDPHVKKQELEKKFPAFMDKHLGAEM
ncbi:MAG: ABC transporter permease, partial [Chloroflexota bacterium]